MRKVIVNCCVCGNPFEAMNRGKRYCSVTCKNMAASERDRIRYRQEKERKSRPQRKKKSKSLAEWDAEARAAGMSYGQYRAMVEMKNGRTENI